MKKILLTAWLVLSVAFAYAQSISMTAGGQQVSNGQTIHVYGYVDGIEEYCLKTIFTLTNTTSSDIKVVGSKRVVGEVSEGSSDSWCGFGQCWPGDNISEQTVGAGEVVGKEYADGNHNAPGFYGEFFPGEYAVKDTYTVEYTFSVVGSETDKLVFTVVYTTTAEAANEALETVKAKASVYPNPAKDFVNFNVTLGNTASSTDLLLYTISGELKQRVCVRNQESLRLDLSGYKSGLYFYAIEQNGEVILTGKLMIQ